MSAGRAQPSDTHADADGMPAEIEVLLRELLVGSRRVRVDPSTGRIMGSDEPAPEKSLTDRPVGNSIA